MAKWKSKKKNVVDRSSVEAEYRAMAKSTTKLVWLKHLLGELGFQVCVSMDLWCDNQATIHIATNPSMSRLNTLKKMSLCSKKGEGWIYLLESHKYQTTTG